MRTFIQLTNWGGMPIYIDIEFISAVSVHKPKAGDDIRCFVYTGEARHEVRETATKVLIEINNAEDSADKMMKRDEGAFS